MCIRSNTQSPKLLKCTSATKQLWERESYVMPIFLLRFFKDQGLSSTNSTILHTLPPAH